MDNNKTYRRKKTRPCTYSGQFFNLVAIQAELFQGPLIMEYFGRHVVQTAVSVVKAPHLLLLRLEAGTALAE